MIYSDAMAIKDQKKREQLTHDGFCVFNQVLNAETVANLNAMSEWTIEKQRLDNPDHFERHRSQGCIIPYWKYPHTAFAELIANDGAMNSLAGLGFDQPKVWSGFVISKPPKSPPLYWHQDGVLWDHPISLTGQPQQFFLMYYLVDTTPENGCLRVIPGSHRQRHSIHDIPRKAHQDDAVGRAEDMQHPAMRKAEGEIDVPVQAGDVVMGDSRLLHSAHGNNSDAWRTVLTIWYWPAYNELPNEVKALVVRSLEDPTWQSWVQNTQSITKHLIPHYDGKDESISWNNQPGNNLE